MNPFRNYEGPRTRYPAARAANNFLSFLELLIWCGAAIGIAMYENAPSRITILAALAFLVVATSLSIVQYWTVTAILDIADDLNKLHDREDWRDTKLRESQSER